MPAKDKLDVLDLETLPANLIESAQKGNLQWIIKVLNAEKIKSLISGHPNVDKEESKLHSMKVNEDFYQRI
jgi:hypothetical protein